jgi:hypothetical protein
MIKFQVETVEKVAITEEVVQSFQVKVRFLVRKVAKLDSRYLLILSDFVS